jgi:thiol-disulfide isomerase/thioredoxin
MKSTKKSFIIGLIVGVIGILAIELSLILWYGKIYRPKILTEALEPPPINKEKFSDSYLIYNLNVTSATNKKTFSLSEFKDKLIFLNIWATWCNPCIAEFPSIKNLNNKLEDRDIEFVILSEEEPEKVEKFEKKRKFNLPFYTTTEPFPASFKGESIPRTYIIKNGEIIYSHSGMAKWDDKNVIEMINNYIE